MGKEPSEHTFEEHLFEYRSVQSRKLILSLIVTSLVMIIEVIGGFFTNSMALISDAGHMFTHAFALAVSLMAIFIARKPRCHHRTFGLYRAEILAAFINGLFLLLIVGIIIYESVVRIIHPKPVLSLPLLIIALLGLIVNVWSVFILRGSPKGDLNIRSVFYHMILDAASSVGIIIAAIVIFYTGWNILDPLLSMGIAALIIYWAWGVLKDSTKILLEIAPSGLNVDIISDDLKNHFPEIQQMYNLHLWTITSDMIVFSAHITLANASKLPDNREALISEVNKYLYAKYKIIESTNQIASTEEAESCNINTRGASK